MRSLIGGQICLGPSWRDHILFKHHAELFADSSANPEPIMNESLTQRIVRYPLSWLSRLIYHQDKCLSISLSCVMVKGDVLVNGLIDTCVMVKGDVLVNGLIDTCVMVKGQFSYTDSYIFSFVNLYTCKTEFLS